MIKNVDLLSVIRSGQALDDINTLHSLLGFSCQIWIEQH